MAHKAIAQLALAFDLPVIPIFPIRSDDGRYKIIYREVLKLTKTGNMEKDVRATTQLFQDVIEEMVRQYPVQWWWAHDRWKHGEEAADE